MQFIKRQSLDTRLRASVAVFALASGVVIDLSSSRADAAVTAYRPSDPSQVVLRLGDSDGETALARLRAESLANPNDDNALTRYVQALLAMGEKTGNERFYGFAERAVDTAPEAVRLRVARLHAQLLQHRHDFRAAEKILNEILVRDPRDVEARLMRAQVQLHLHEPEKAERDCSKLLLDVDLLTGTTCAAQARAAMSADLAAVERAYALVTALLTTATGFSSTRSWSAGVAAELAARLRNDGAAERWYRTAYELDRDSHYARLSYTDWLLAQGRHTDAYEIARQGASNADLLRTVLAQKTDISRAAKRLQLSWREAAARGERTHLRDQARFELWVLNDVPRAHATALDNFREQREADDALLLAQTSVLQKDSKALTLVKEWQIDQRYADRRLDELLASRQ